MKFAVIRPFLTVEWLASALAFLLLYVLCWAVYKDYGVSIDEPLHMTRVPQYFHQWRQIFEQGYVERVDIGMRYGVLFNLVAHPFIVTFSKNTRFLLEAYEIKHAVTFHIYFLAYGAIAYAFHKACQFRYSVVLSIFILTLFPNLFGQSFFNPKDIPFAAFYTFSSVFIGIKTAQVMQAMEKEEGVAGYILVALIFALLLAMGAGVRIAGLALLPAWCAAMFLCCGPKAFFRAFRRLLPLWGATAIFLVLLLLVIYPSALSNPASWFVKTVDIFNNGTGIGEHTTFMRIVFYLLAKPPLVWVFLTLGGISYFLFHFDRLSPVLRSVGIMLLAQLVIIPTVMVVMETRTYHQERHFMLAYPPMAFFAGYGAVMGWRSLKNKTIKYICVALIFLASVNIAKEMKALHPYQYVYLNEVARYYPMFSGEPRDYWGISRKPLIEWLARHGKRGSRIRTQLWYAFAPHSIAVNLYGKRRLRYSHRAKLIVGSRLPEGCKVIREEIRYLGNIKLDLAGIYDCY